MNVEMIKLNDTMLQKLHVIQLEMLLEIHRICCKHRIKYTIIGGTLLGAVRNGGFIPWDDDADVAMLRVDYEKFCNVCKRELDFKRFYLQNMDITKGYRWGYAKLRRRNTLFVRENQEHMKYKQGVFVDIFPIDATPNNVLLREIHNFECFLVRKILWSAVGQYASKTKIERLLCRLLYLIPENSAKKMYKSLIRRKDSNTSNMVRTLTFPAPKRLHGYYRKWFAETALISFEGFMFEGVKDYDGWLKLEFGDYMQLPPADKRKVHPVTAIKLIDVEIKKEK